MADGVLGRVVVGREQAAVHVAFGSASLVAGVSHGLPEQAIGRDVFNAIIKDGPYRVDVGTACSLSLATFSSGSSSLILCTTL